MLTVKPWALQSKKPIVRRSVPARSSPVPRRVPPTTAQSGGRTWQYEYATPPSDMNASHRAKKWPAGLLGCPPTCYFGLCVRYGFDGKSMGQSVLRMRLAQACDLAGLLQRLERPPNVAADFSGNQHMSDGPTTRRTFRHSRKKLLVRASSIHGCFPSPPSWNQSSSLPSLGRHEPSQRARASARSPPPTRMASGPPGCPAGASGPWACRPAWPDSASS
jgi:hypothetical protein